MHIQLITRSHTHFLLLDLTLQKHLRLLLELKSLHVCCRGNGGRNRRRFLGALLGVWLRGRSLQGRKWQRRGSGNFLLLFSTGIDYSLGRLER